jgi:hypothetical protein
MLDQNLKTFYEEIVERLIMQYREYVFLSEMIQKLENDRFAEAARIAKEKNISISDITQSKKSFAPLRLVDQKIALLKTDLQRLSDEMTYPNHYVWMMYKDKAYKGTSTEIATLADFKRHCSPEGYICTTRFKFMNEYLKRRAGVNLDDDNQYPPTMKLSDFYERSEILKLLEDTDFLAQWKGNEYLVSKNRINKWNTAVLNAAALP